MAFDSWKNRFFSSLGLAFGSNFIAGKLYGFQVLVCVPSIVIDLSMDFL